MKDIVISILQSDAIIVTIFPLLIGGAYQVYNAAFPGLGLLTKYDFASLKYVIYLFICWLASAFSSVAILTILDEGSKATVVIKNIYIFIAIICLIITILSFIMWLPRIKVSSFVFGMAPVISGFGLGVGVFLKNQTCINSFGCILIVAEIVGLIYYSGFSKIHTHEYGELKLSDGEVITCKCRDMRFHGFKQIIEIKQTDEMTTLIPYCQVMKIKYEGKTDKVEDESSLRYLGKKLLTIIKKKLMWRKKS